MKAVSTLLAGLLAGVVTGILVVVMALVPAAPAQAHSYLVDSTPEIGEVLTALPEHFAVKANEPLLDLDGKGSGFGIEVIDSEGLYYGDGCVTVDGPTVYSTAALGEPGRYLLVYQWVSADGHALSDQFSFDWAPAGEYTVSTGSTSPGDCNGLYSRVDDSAEGAEGTSADLADLLWIGGALLAVVVAVGVTVLLLRRRRA